MFSRIPFHRVNRLISSFLIGTLALSRTALPTYVWFFGLDAFSFAHITGCKPPRKPGPGVRTNNSKEAIKCRPNCVMGSTRQPTPCDGTQCANPNGKRLAKTFTPASTRRGYPAEGTASWRNESPKGGGSICFQADRCVPSW